MKPVKAGLERLLDATRYSWQGLRAAYRYEVSFRQELLLGAVLLPASFWLAANLVEWILLVLPLFIMLIVELLNSAIECVIDRISDEIHEMSGRAKDIGSAAVLVSLLLVAAVWLPLLWRQFNA